MKRNVFVLFDYDAEQAVPRELPGISKSEYSKLPLPEKQKKWIGYLSRQIWEDGKLRKRSLAELTAIKNLRCLFSEFGGKFTAFLLGRWLEFVEKEFGRSAVRKAFDGVDAQSHSFSHGMWRSSGDSVRDSLAPLVTDIREEVGRGIAAVERIVGVRPNGIRPPMGGTAPLGKTNPEVLPILRENGITFLSSWLKRSKTEGGSVPESQPFPYSESGFGEILEIPACGLFDVHWRNPTRLLIFDDESEPSVGDMLQHYLSLLKTALSMKGEITIVSFVFHPWAVAHYDPDLSLHRSVLQFCKEKGVSVISHRELRNQFS